MFLRLRKEIVMSRNSFKYFALMMIMIFSVGCANRGVTIKGYIQDKERLDQNLRGGNAGYLYGEPKEEDLVPGKKTRKVYVVEFTKATEEVAQKEYSSSGYADSEVYDEKYPRKTLPEDLKQRYTVPDISLPAFDDDIPVVEQQQSSLPEGTYIEYTVMKDDTLQKISKKFYDSYSKWPIIYDANKDVIQSPHVIKPGIVIKIPNE